MPVLATPLVRAVLLHQPTVAVAAVFVIGEFRYPNHGWFDLDDLIEQTGPVDEIATVAFFGS